MAALTIEELKDYSLLSRGTIEVLEVNENSWLLVQIDSETSGVYAKLRKRYAVPFAEPTPTIVKRWVAAFVDRCILTHNGISPLDTLYDDVIKRVDTVTLEITDACEPEKGLAELPLIGDSGPSGVKRPATLGYAESSPFTWMADQRRNGRREDGRGC